MTDELNSDLMSMVLRQASEPCIERRLNELRAIVTQWETTGSYEAPQWVSQSPIIEIELSRYDAALCAGRLALLSGEEQYRMGAVAKRIGRFNEWQFAERVPWGRLRALQFGATALSAEDRATIRSALQDAATFDYEPSLRPLRHYRWPSAMDSGPTRRAFASWHRRSGQAANSRRRSVPRLIRPETKPTRRR